MRRRDLKPLTDQILEKKIKAKIYQIHKDMFSERLEKHFEIGDVTLLVAREKVKLLESLL